MRPITVQDLQRLSADAIKALPHTVPIKDGAETIAVLTPVRNAPPEHFREVFADIDATARIVPHGVV